MLFEIYP